MFDIINTLVMAFYSVQFLIFPVYVFYKGGFSLTEYNEKVYYNIVNAVLLQCFVLLIVTIYLSLSKKNIFQGQTVEFNSNIIFLRRTKLLILLLIIISVMIIIKYPQILLKFRFIFYSNSKDYYAFLEASQTVKKSMPIFVYQIGLWIIQITKLIICYFVIMIIWKKLKDHQPIIAILLSVIVIATSCVFTTEDKAATVFSAIACILLLAKLYSKYTKSIVNIAGMSMIIIIFVFFILLPMMRSTTEDVVAYKLNSYFSGTVNVAGGFAMAGGERFESFFGDILRSIPLINHYFVNMPMSYLEFNRALGYDTVYNSQIIPIISQGYYYFGLIGAAVFPVILIRFSKKMFQRLNNCTDSFEFYTFAMLFVFSFLGVYLYDLALTFSQILNYCIPFAIIYLLTRRKKYIR